MKPESSSIEITEVTSPALLDQYIRLPYRIYAGYKNFVPPLISDEKEFHNPKKNFSLNSNPFIRLLALKDGTPVGRIMGIIPVEFNSSRTVKHGRFFHFDCENDPEVARRLTDFIYQWVKNHNMQQLTGPYGFSDKDPQGLQIEGFGHLPVIAAPCNPPYLPELLVKMGFEKEVDCVSYSVPVPPEIPPAYRLIAQRLLSSGKYRCLSFTNRLSIRKYIVPVMELVNESFREIYGFNIMDQREMKQLADKFMLFIDPRFLKLVTDSSDRPVAFIIGIPDISSGLQKAKGKLFPFGFYHILRAAKKSTQLDLLLGAVHPSLQSKGITALLAVEFLEAAIRHGMKTMDTHLVLETNTMMNREMLRAGGQLYKRFRIFKKPVI